MDLFIRPVEFEKTAYIRVSENPIEWTRDIMEQFYNQFPYFINFPVRVEFKQKDEQKGYAVGAIHIENNSGIVVPIVIQNRELFPFDVALVNGQTLPLNEYTINSYLSGKQPFLKTVKREDSDINTLLFNSGSLGYVREMPTETYKTASLLDAVLPHTSPEEREIVLQTIAENENIAEGFKQNKTGSTVIKIATSKAEPEIEKTAEQVQKLIDRDIWYIYKQGEFNYKIIAGNSLIDDPIELDIDEVDIQKLGETVRTQSQSINEGPPQSKPVAVLPVKDEDYSIVLLDDGNYVELPKSAVVSAPITLTKDPELEAVSVKKYGCFRLPDGKYTKPFEVESIVTVNNVMQVNGSTALNKYAYALYEGIDEPWVDTDGTTWLPKDTKFVKLGTCQKTTHGKMLSAKNKVIKTANGYVLDGAELSRYIKTTEPVELHKAAWALVQCGASKDNVTKLANMRDGESLTIWEPLRVPEWNISKIAEAHDAEETLKAEKIKKLARNFIKEAAVIPDLPTVDKVLALNFVNKNTVNTFIEALPTLEGAMFAVAEMLLKTRVGVQILPESALRNLMFGLVEAVQVLKGISSMKGNK